MESKPAAEADVHSPSSSSDPLPPSPRAAAPTAHGLRFRGIFVALCILSFISALDVAIITTALPRIIAEIGGGGGSMYIWIANSFTIASSVLQPLSGQLANLYGRRLPLIAAVALFMLGSGIAGGASNPGMLIAGRTVQGVGAGTIYVLLDIICCDLVPQRERGKYLGLMFSWSGVAAGLGPVVGGAIAQSNWRWIFYLNLPICGVALAAVLLFMRVRVGREELDWSVKVRRLDPLGNVIFIPSIIAVLVGLITGGVTHPWSSWRVVLPLVLGLLGWAAFHAHQHFVAAYPSVPSRLFANRTAGIAYLFAFFSSTTVQAVSYFLPVYFQGERQSSVLRSGVSFLPFALGTLVFAVLAGILLSKFGAYRPLHAISFALAALGFGLFTLLDNNSSKAGWAVFQLIAGAGAGLVLSTILPAILASLPEADVAAATAAYSFIRTFGYIWGVSVASIIFTAVTNAHVDTVQNPALADELRDGGAYAFAGRLHDIAYTLSAEDLDQVGAVYRSGLKVIWWVGLGVSIVCFLAVGGEKGLELRQDLETEFGIAEEKKNDVDADK